ncbi:permease [Bacteroidetes/Chlorobi group bacterium ChocPot_Mid]|nr:MAG: permease [Bacteroidetes/Chlorobi group bacterium ChocPot_Mid]
MFIIGILKETLLLFIEMAPYMMLGLIFVGLLNLFFNKDLIIKHIGKNNFMSVFKAALFGIPLPLCSCGVVPSAVYMSKNGASKGSVVSFLIATPQTGIDSIIATYGMLGWIFAIFRPFAALIMGIVGGTVVRFLKLEKSNSKYVGDASNLNDKINSSNAFALAKNDECNDNCSTIIKTKSSKSKQFFQYSFVEFLDDISFQFIIGLFISGLIAFMIPDNFFQESTINNGIAGMLLMILVGVPMYVCATASIPIAVTLMMKGFSPGVAFVFLAVGPATNAASFTIIMNTLGKKIAIVYVLMISITAILFGLLLDLIINTFNINIHTMMSHSHNHEGMIPIELQWLTSIIFFILLLASLYRKFIKSKIIKKEETVDSKTIKIEGMTCNHCVMNVKKAISSVEGVSDVEVNLSQGEAYVKGDFDLSKVNTAITDVGYKVV